MRRGAVMGTVLAMAAAFLAGTPGADTKKESAVEVRGPHEPSSPAVEMRDPDGAVKETDCPATIVTARGGKRTGTLALKPGKIELEVMENGARRRMSVSLADVESIEFSRWRGTERRKGEFVFHPSEARIVLWNRKVLLCTGGIPLLNRVSFTYRGERRFIYSFFYDYWKNNAWKNSGQRGRDYPETAPFGDTLVKIIFIRGDMINPLERLLSR